jgi:dephospho-CoA kinase
MAVRRVGLTGGIGSGKSTVAAFWVSLGARLIDTDAIAREITAPGGAALKSLVAEFGLGVVDEQGGLDRARMRQMAFSDPAVRQRLEARLHPMISELAMRRAGEAPEPPLLLFDVPLLAESSTWRNRCERILVVDCSEATQVDRVRRRSAWPEDQVRRVIEQQSPRKRRRAIADAVINNDNSSLEALQREVEALWHLWTGRPPEGVRLTL